MGPQKTIRACVEGNTSDLHVVGGEHCHRVEEGNAKRRVKWLEGNSFKARRGETHKQLWIVTDRC